LAHFSPRNSARPTPLSPAQNGPDRPVGAADRPTEGEAPLGAVHTPNFPALLRHLGASLLVSTYQAGKLVLVRDEGDHLNTHFRVFQAPMGLALDGDRLAVGTTIQVWECVNVPAVAAKLDPPGRHDTCFLPRSSHVTGNIQAHEMAYDGGGDLWVVNTRFSCLCTLDPSASFVPRWRPPFISALEPSDRCHFNGLGMVNGSPRYVTAHGQSNEPAGWRADKAEGGILMDVDSGEVITRGLPMPQSPHWYGGRLWACESGTGTVGVIDPGSGKYEPVAELPGYTRGLDFAGNFAFVGLSQVRESAVFSGIPITERLAEGERTCGVCALDLTSGRVVALLRFETTVQEVFAVTVMPGRRYPDLVNDDDTLLENCLVIPAEHLGEVAATVRAPGPA
jgi:uncharacterized protein (TIGR03032 family)